MRLYSIPPTHRARGADPVRFRTRRAQTAQPEETSFVVNSADHTPLPVSQARLPLVCTKCGGARVAGVRMLGEDFEVDCLDCGDWQAATKVLS